MEQDEQSVEERISGLEVGAAALGVLTDSLLQDAELLCERLCRLEEYKGSKVMPAVGSMSSSGNISPSEGSPSKARPARPPAARQSQSPAKSVPRRLELEKDAVKEAASIYSKEEELLLHYAFSDSIVRGSRDLNEGLEGQVASCDAEAAEVAGKATTPCAHEDDAELSGGLQEVGEEGCDGEDLVHDGVAATACGVDALLVSSHSSAHSVDKDIPATEEMGEGQVACAEQWENEDKLQGHPAVELDVDSGTLERALMWMMDNAPSRLAESGGDATDDRRNRSLEGMDQGDALSLLMFADFLQCGGLLHVTCPSTCIQLSMPGNPVGNPHVLDGDILNTLWKRVGCPYWNCALHVVCNSYRVMSSEE